MKKRIETPEPQPMIVTLPDGKVEKRAVEFKAYVIQCWLSDPRFGQSLHSLRELSKLKKKVSESNGHIDLEMTEWSALKTVCENPHKPYVVQDADSILVFADAILNAKEKNGSE